MRGAFGAPALFVQEMPPAAPVAMIFYKGLKFLKRVAEITIEGISSFRFLLLGSGENINFYQWGMQQC